ncbi:MAG: prolipoprotein diacylglyceryl transferase [Anaerolineae bacterium]|nr:prolipoprotein diacylglyceryl transferase [Anaerolineae bacterium]
MLPLLRIGPLSVRTPELLLLAGLWLGLEAASRLGRERGLDPDRVFALGFNAALAGLLGSRLGFVLLHLPAYSAITPLTRALLSIVTPLPGTENAAAGLVVGLVAGAYFARRWHMPVLDLLDSYALGGLVLLAFGMLANLASGDYYGVATVLPWGIPLWGASRHPLQAYVLLAAVGLLALAWRRRVVLAEPGLTTRLILIGVGLMLLVFESLRADSPVFAGGLRFWQIAGLAGTVLALAWFAWRAPLTEPDAR